MRVGAAIDEIVAISDTLTNDLVQPPRDSGDVCPACRTWKAGASAAVCENCVEVQEVLGEHPLALSLVSLYAKPSQLRDWLTRYKGRADGEDALDPDFSDIVRSLLGRFIVEHGRELTERLGGVDAIVVVPSTDRLPPHPLEAIVASLELDVPLLRVLARGPGDLAFRRPNRQGYLARDIDQGARMLILDDVYTTGARINSAACALGDAGAVVAGAVVIARRVNPDYVPRARALWEACRATPYDWASSPYLAGGGR